MRQLNKTVLAGGVIYPAGTPATPELEDLIPDVHWDGARISVAPSPTPEGSHVVVSTHVSGQARVYVDGVEVAPEPTPTPAAVEQPEVPAVTEPTPEPDDAADEDNEELDEAPPAPVPAPPNYQTWSKPDLEAELARRNEGRDEDALILVAGRVTKASIAAALQADDDDAANA